MKLNKFIFRTYAKKGQDIIFVCHRDPGVSHVVADCRYGFDEGNHFISNNKWKGSHSSGRKPSPELHDYNIPLYGDL